MEDRELAEQLSMLRNRIGINSQNILTGAGMVEDIKKVNTKIEKIEDRLETIEKWETATNQVVTNVLKMLDKIYKVILGIIGYIMLKDIGNTEVVKGIVEIIKKLIL